jgi:hypothetical protein
VSRKRKQKVSPRQAAFVHPPPELKPGEGLTEPRLWIRRLRLWHDFADDDAAHGRNIEFRRGLNIVWSPAGPTADQLSTGHAAGKTLLCRQIRYCLGEDTFADPEDTAAIRMRFPKSGVGAEVRLCGETWVVRRAFASRSDDRALRAESLDAVADDAHRGSFGAFRDAIDVVAFTDTHRELLTELSDIEVPWQYVLAWLTRDQECRLDGLTHWRHPESSSHSPVRKAATETRLNVLRMAIGLYSEQSNITRRQVAEASEASSTAESEARQADERFKVLRRDLAAALAREQSSVWPPPPPPPDVALHDEQAAREAHARSLEAAVEQRLRSATGCGGSAASATIIVGTAGIAARGKRGDGCSGRVIDGIGDLGAGGGRERGCRVSTGRGERKWESSVFRGRRTDESGEVLAAVQEAGEGHEHWDMVGARATAAGEDGAGGDGPRTGPAARAARLARALRLDHRGGPVEAGDRRRGRDRQGAPPPRSPRRPC